jgi:hypothetical protein
MRLTRGSPARHRPWRREQPRIGRPRLPTRLIMWPRSSARASSRLRTGMIRGAVRIRRAPLSVGRERPAEPRPPPNPRRRIHPGHRKPAFADRCATHRSPGSTPGCARRRCRGPSRSPRPGRRVASHAVPAGHRGEVRGMAPGEESSSLAHDDLRPSVARRSAGSPAPLAAGRRPEARVRSPRLDSSRRGGRSACRPTPAGWRTRSVDHHRRIVHPDVDVPELLESDVGQMLDRTLLAHVRGHGHRSSSCLAALVDDLVEHASRPRRNDDRATEAGEGDRGGAIDATGRTGHHDRPVTRGRNEERHHGDPGSGPPPRYGSGRA